MASGDHGLSIEHTNLGYIKTLKEKYKVPVGFIDHTPLMWMPTIAVASGANVITKHLAISRSLKGPDWKVCLEPDEMKDAVKWIKQTKISINNNQKEIAPGEKIDKSLMRRSVVSKKFISKNKKIKQSDICFKRPGIGIPSNKSSLVIGKVSSVDIEKDELIFSENLIDN